MHTGLFVVLGPSDCRHTTGIGIRSTFVPFEVFWGDFVLLVFLGGGLQNIIDVAVSIMIKCSSSTFFIHCLLQTVNTIDSWES